MTEIGQKATAHGQAPRTVLAGLAGRGIQLSRSPAMHEAEGAAQGLRYVYRLFDTELMKTDSSVGEILRAAEICGFSGMNITYPYKVAVIEYLDKLSDAAASVGAVNTVVFRNGKRYGHNTDLWGFAESFRHGMADAARGKVLLMGAGGAGAAVAHALMQCGVGQLLIADTDLAKADRLAAAICAESGTASALPFNTVEAAVAHGPEGIVNATPLGMASVPGCAIPAGLIDPAMWVADIVYFPLETELLRLARQIGCRTLPGTGMAVFQAVRSFEHFTGLKADSERMEAAFRRFEAPAPA